MLPKFFLCQSIADSHIYIITTDTHTVHMCSHNNGTIYITAYSDAEPSKTVAAMYRTYRNIPDLPVVFGATNAEPPEWLICDKYTLTLDNPISSYVFHTSAPRFYAVENINTATLDRIIPIDPTNANDWIKKANAAYDAALT